MADVLDGVKNVLSTEKRKKSGDASLSHGPTKAHSPQEPETEQVQNRRRKVGYAGFSDALVSDGRCPRPLSNNGVRNRIQGVACLRL